MNITDDMSFDEWFDSFVTQCGIHGYEGPIDKYTFEADYEDGKKLYKELFDKEFED